MKRISRRQMLRTGFAGAMAVGASPLCAAENFGPVREFSFHRDYIIGTSFDAWLQLSDAEEADHCEQAMLGEIERLRLIFSTYDPTSEISWLNGNVGPASVSPDLFAVLRDYEYWSARTNGALNAQLGGFVRAWEEAQRYGQSPNADELSRIVERISAPGWALDEATRTVSRLTDEPFNLNSIAKGFIIQKAVAVARAAVPSLQAVLLNIGGDMLSWRNPANSPSGCLIGVQDPFRPEENAPPLTALHLDNRAVATSGGYQRHFAVGQKRLSHLIDPRSGNPALAIASATVLAPNSVIANALATSLCIMPIKEGLKLVSETPGVDCLLVAADKRQWRSSRFGESEVAFAAQTEEKAPDKAANSWPDDYQVSISIELPKIEAVKYRRPYVAIWIENGEGKSIRSVTVWGLKRKYWPSLPGWWKFAKDDMDLVKSVTRATRSPGRYDVVWDGKDDQGTRVPKGTYTVRVEVHREHGKDLVQTGKIVCGADPAKISLAKNDETGDTSVAYEKKK